MATYPRLAPNGLEQDNPNHDRVHPPRPLDPPDRDFPGADIFSEDRGTRRAHPL